MMRKARRKVRLRFSLRLILCTVGLLSVVAAIVSWSYRQQVGLEKSILNAGGACSFQWQGSLRARYVPSSIMASVPSKQYSGSMGPIPEVQHQPVVYWVQLPDSAPLPMERPIWIPLDVRYDWDINYISLPIDKLDDRFVDRIAALPSLKYLVVTGVDTNWTKELGVVAKNHDEELKLLEIQQHLPDAVVLNALLYNR